MIPISFILLLHARARILVSWWIHKQTPKGGSIRIEKSSGSLPLLKQKLETRGVRAASAQLAHVCNKMFTTLESKGILRTAPEEFMLASQYRPDDELFAEFIRTFRTTFFRSLLRRAFRRFSRG